ncbi:MAG: XRE family transcriptional regulator [Lachnospiraceae bacterium]|nr:MAG: XRE family transcriptional regulator [Lachnospiraceae bacterium]
MLSSYFLISSNFQERTAMLKDNPLHIFSERLSSLLEENNIKKADFANEIGISPTTLSGYLSGKHCPDFETLMTICKKLGTHPDYLLGMSTNKLQDPSTFSSQENELLKYYKQLSENQQYFALGEVKMLFKKGK